MSITIPTGDRKIDLLLVELSDLVNKHGNESFQVEIFISTNEDASWVDRFTGTTHYFSEIAGNLALLMGGITNPDPEIVGRDEDGDENDPADWWKQDD